MRTEQLYATDSSSSAITSWLYADQNMDRTVKWTSVKNNVHTFFLTKHLYDVWLIRHCVYHTYTQSNCLFNVMRCGAGGRNRLVSVGGGVLDDLLTEPRKLIHIDDSAHNPFRKDFNTFENARTRSHPHTYTHTLWTRVQHRNLRGDDSTASKQTLRTARTSICVGGWDLECLTQHTVHTQQYTIVCIRSPEFQDVEFVIWPKSYLAAKVPLVYPSLLLSAMI